MNAEIHVIDSFTHKAFRGNPAAVCITGSEPDPGWMQLVAAEMRHSETAFLSGAGEEWNLRWFTPVSEVDLCGHGTLAAAFVLYNTGRVEAGTRITFRTRSGNLAAWKEGTGIALDFPAVPVTRSELPAGLEPALGARAIFSGRTKFDLFVELPSAADVCDLDPDIAALARIKAQGIIVTAIADMPDYDFVSRFFAPSVGVPEDPVTGSAHCSLAPYWAGKLSRDRLAGFQCSSRGGVVRVALSGDRVILCGDATPVLSGQFIA